MPGCISRLLQGYGQVVIPSELWVASDLMKFSSGGGESIRKVDDSGNQWRWLKYIIGEYVAQFALWCLSLGRGAWERSQRNRPIAHIKAHAASVSG
jgi:hypothetical protein